MCEATALRALLQGYRDICAVNGTGTTAVDEGERELDTLVANLATAHSERDQARTECDAMIDTCKDLGTEIAELRVDRNKWMLLWKSAEGFSL